MFSFQLAKRCSLYERRYELKKKKKEMSLNNDKDSGSNGFTLYNLNVIPGRPGGILNK